MKKDLTQAEVEEAIENIKKANPAWFKSTGFIFPFEKKIMIKAMYKVLINEYYNFHELKKGNETF